MNMQERAEYSVTDRGRFEDSAFYKWFWQNVAEGKFNKDYVSRWDLFRKRKND